MTTLMYFVIDEITRIDVAVNVAETKIVFLHEFVYYNHNVLDAMLVLNQKMLSEKIFLREAC